MDTCCRFIGPSDGETGLVLHAESMFRFLLDAVKSLNVCLILTKTVSVSATSHCSVGTKSPLSLLVDTAVPVHAVPTELFFTLRKKRPCWDVTESTI